MAPFLAMTSRQTFRRPSAQAAATRRACCERQMARTRAVNAVFPKAGRPSWPKPSYRKLPATILLLRGHRRYESFDTCCVHVENDFGVN